MSIQDSIRSLAEPVERGQRFAEAPTVGARVGLVATGRGSVSTGGGGSVALEEDDYTQREYWTTVNKTSTDGLLTIQIKPIKSILLTDGSRATFKQPV